MPAPVTAPSARPAQGFTSARAQRWILASAIVIALTYSLRRIVEPATEAPARGGKASRLAGAGSPPPSLSHWAVAYGAGFAMLALVAMAAPELAASLAALTVTGTLLANGTSIVADIAGLEGTGGTHNLPGGGTAPNAPGTTLNSLGFATNDPAYKLQGPRG